MANQNAKGDLIFKKKKWHSGCFEVTGYESKIKIYKFNMADPIWLMAKQNWFDFNETRHSSLSKVFHYDFKFRFAIRQSIRIWKMYSKANPSSKLSYKRFYAIRSLLAGWRHETYESDWANTTSRKVMNINWTLESLL